MSEGWGAAARRLPDNTGGRGAVPIRSLPQRAQSEPASYKAWMGSYGEADDPRTPWTEWAGCIGSDV